MSLSYKVITGHEIEEYVEHIAGFRLENFQEFPYLYKGDLESERRYVQDYSKHDDSLLVLVFSGKDLVAISTCLPLKALANELKEIRDKVFDSGRKYKDYFYFAETIISKKFRGQGIVSKILKLQESLARDWGYKYACFITVIRSANDPMRPKNYKDIDPMLEAKGYRKTDLDVIINWPVIQPDDSIVDQPNHLAFWEKKL